MKVFDCHCASLRLTKKLTFSVKLDVSNFNKEAQDWLLSQISEITIYLDHNNLLGIISLKEDERFGLAKNLVYSVLNIKPQE